jgi:hypothetical protein
LHRLPDYNKKCHGTCNKAQTQSICWQPVNTSRKNNLSWEINLERSICHIQQRCCLPPRKELKPLCCFWRKQNSY